MLVYEIWEEYKKYRNYTPFLDDEPTLSLGHAGYVKFGWRGDKVAVYKSEFGDRGRDSLRMTKYSHEGSAVYDALSEAKYCLRGEPEKWFEDFEILTKENDRNYPVKYGAVIKIDGRYRVYLADAQTFTLAGDDFDTAKSAAAHFESMAANDPAIQDIIDKFIADYHGETRNI